MDRQRHLTLWERQQDAAEQHPTQATSSGTAGGLVRNLNLGPPGPTASPASTAPHSRARPGRRDIMVGPAAHGVRGLCC